MKKINLTRKMCIAQHMQSRMELVLFGMSLEWLEHEYSIYDEDDGDDRRDRVLVTSLGRVICWHTKNHYAAAVTVHLNKVDSVWEVSYCDYMIHKEVRQPADIPDPAITYNIKNFTSWDVDRRILKKRV